LIGQILSVNVTRLKNFFSCLGKQIASFVSWLVEKDNGQETSFFVKAISSGNNLVRALIILLITFFLLQILALKIIDRFVVQVDNISFSEEGNPIIKIKGKQKLQVISVPAYQKWISSGVTLNKNPKIEIRATGSVATGLAVPRYLEDELYKQFNNELGWRLSRLEFNEDAYLGWREADGKLLQGYGSDDPKDTIYGSKCIEEKSSQKKILPNFEYGVLLGFVAEDKPHLADEIFKNKDKDKFFMIGKKAEIEFISQKKSYQVTYLDEKGNNQSLNFPEDEWEGKTLYFTLNEAVVKNKKELEMFAECLQQDQKLPEHLKKYIMHQEKRYQKIYDKLQTPESIWFMDNRGDFTVTIIITE
jgi:hypothetical protein